MATWPLGVVRMAKIVGHVRGDRPLHFEALVHRRDASGARSTHVR